MRIKENRTDITDWLIHFVHDRNIENDFYYLNEAYGEIEEINIPPSSFTFKGEPVFDYHFDYLDNKYYPWAEDESAFGVLLKIIKDGYLKSTWSFRNGKSSIYGPKPVVCYTEMPLYGLINYVKNRNKNELTTNYGIAFLKNEIFEAGARPVIYGLSSPYKEADEKDKYYGYGLRNLAESCGINLREQYRYVSTNLGKKYPIDWTHEREWRWADLDEKFDFPGIPLFIKNDFFDLSTVIIIVYTNKEANQILGLLKSHHDSESTNYGLDLDKQILRNTLILSIESIEEEGDIENIRIDDLPFQKLPKIKEVKPSKECIEKVKQVWEETKNHAYNLAQEAFDKTSDNKLWEKYGPCGGAYVITFDGHSEITQALVELGIATAYTDHYSLGGLKTVGTQMMGIHEIKAKAAAIFLTEKLGQKFLWRTYID